MHKIKLENGKFKFVESYTGLDGKRHRVSVTKNNQTRATEKQAYQELQEKINKKLNKDVGYKNVGYYIDEFLKHKRSYVADNTYKQYKQGLALLDRNIIIIQLNKSFLESYINDLRSKYAPNTLNIYKTILNIFFKYVKKYYHKDFDLNIEFKLTKEDKAKEINKVKFIETNKIKEILSKIKQPIVRDFVTVQLLTGLRAGELLALQKEDINFENNILNITKTRHKNGNVASPKTLTSIRKIEVSQAVIDILYNNLTDERYIFDVSLGNVNSYLRPFKLSTHIFRHTHVALLVEQGIPIKVISERMGHSDISTTLNIYTHVTQNMKVDLVKKLENLGTF
ncbi:site-specific integrase [Gemella sp. GH3]|uniref:tyrosine-type recombinase/integrase n=1 Tax=unclassified Gemella TaxID=2624949 RepID=UPI0015D045F1|nr:MULTISPECIES: site-specific integrase [unclassified Gemella]MBF0714542.1 site-specific integrase [Gemella sp. GH3.1]NYS51494.1 site-specific integrase [Gemella sp. GH3]